MAEAQKPSDDGTPRQRWALTQEAFDRFLASLDTDREAASEKYLLLRRNLVRYFEGRNCRFAEDHADEVLNRLARKLDDGEDIRDINGYAYGIARLLLLEIYKEREREEKALKDLPSLRLVEEDLAEVEKGLACLNHCLDKLPPASRQLILGYYQGDKQSRIENRKQLGKTMGIANQALRSRATRLREKLEACLATCLKKKVPRRHRSGFSATDG